MQWNMYLEKLNGPLVYITELGNTLNFIGKLMVEAVEYPTQRQYQCIDNTFFDHSLCLASYLSNSLNCFPCTYYNLCMHKHFIKKTCSLS